ncbi:MAG: M48 family metalloprotease [Desulfobacteraceae bacterium]|nr:M48 family metalloprotease [Desulfobacterales bacterium]MBL6968067.1 M48 family metalloprotease [Desulfobacteraceae bacterium]MBL7171303.1 M48 family metalloprotease [Desulfobacteraceae bacterium]
MVCSLAYSLGLVLCFSETVLSAEATSRAKVDDRPHVQLAGLLDKLMDPKSKESKILQGVGSILGSATEIDYPSERTIGESLALEGFRRYGMPVKDRKVQEYVNLVGNAVARNSLRPGIPYNFVVIESPLQNAFSCPGGIIFVSSGLLRTIQSEGQLAGILAHEVAHVGHKHALQSIQRARFFQGVGKITSANMKGEKGKEFEDMIGGLQNTLFDKGLDQNMEFEADVSAMETAYRTGYDPEGLMEVLKALVKIEAGSTKKGSWFSTHPPLKERIQKCRTQLSRYPDAKKLARLPERYREYRKHVVD